MTSKTPLIALSLSSLAIGLTSAYADPVFTENFSSYSPGVLTTGSAPANTWANPGGGSVIDDNSTLFTRVTTDTGNLFGKGTSNQYLRIADTSNSNNGLNYNLVINDTTIGQVGTLSFNFYNPSDAGAQGNGWLLRIATAAGNSSTAFGLYLLNGQLRVAETNNVEPASTAFASYSLDTLNSLVIYYNTTDSDVAYGSRTLTANTMDVWLNGSVAGSALARSGGLAGNPTLDSFGITRKVSSNTSSDFVGTLLMDDIQAFSGIEASAIPEPNSAAALGGLGALLAALLLRRRVR